MRRRWSEKEKAFARANRTADIHFLAEQLGRTPDAVAGFFCRDGIRRARWKRWPRRHTAFVKRYWQVMTDRQIARVVHRSPAAVKRHRHRHGLIHKTGQRSRKAQFGIQVTEVLDPRDAFVATVKSDLDSKKYLIARCGEGIVFYVEGEGEEPPVERWVSVHQPS